MWALAGSLVLVGGSIVGRVVDANGRPVKGVSIVAADQALTTVNVTSPSRFFVANPSEHDQAIASEGRLSAQATSDARGEFALQGLRQGSFSLFAGHLEQGSAFALDVEPDGERRELTLQAHGQMNVTLRGWDYDPKRHVLELVPRRRVANLSFFPIVTVRPGAGWSFGPLPPQVEWDFVLTEFVIERAYRATLLRLPVDARIGAATQADFDFGAGTRIRGRVLDRAGDPAPWASVLLHPEGSPRFELGATSDAQGRFELAGAPGGRAELTAQRWILRPTPGCGVGPRDLFGRVELDLPREGAVERDLACTESTAILAPGDLAPSFRAPTLAGGEVVLEELRGRVVLIDFWATWCGLCRADFPKLRALHRELAPRGFTIVGVSIDDDAAAALRLATSLGLSWPQTALGPADENPLARLFNVAGTPNSFLLDREGRIVAQNPSPDELRRLAIELLDAR